MSDSLTPKQIVDELDRFIIGQHQAKKSVAIALRNRWRRQQLSDEMRDEVLPKNILMIGPTGCGKTEIARRLAKLADAPFIKVEATKFTEIGYVGKDVEQIIRDLVDNAVQKERNKQRKTRHEQAHDNAMERVIDALVGVDARDATRESYRQQLMNGELQDKEIEISISESISASMPTVDIPGMPGAQMGMLNIGDVLGKALGERTTKKRMSVAKSYDILIDEEADKLIDEEQIIKNALEHVENNAIVFLDEIDKICIKESGRNGDVSRQGVQRDLLPLIEGTIVNTRHGSINTDHILFIASGAFHLSKPADLLPELQGRLPIRVTLDPLAKEDFYKILNSTENNLIKQYKALIGTENVTLDFDDDAVDAMAQLAIDINDSVENIGARRLHTIIEHLLEDVSFNASEMSGESVKVNRNMVEEKLEIFTHNSDLSHFIL